LTENERKLLEWARVVGRDRTVEVLTESFVQERVHLPVCPVCERVMKPQGDGRWKCCGAVYRSTAAALCAFGVSAAYAHIDRLVDQTFEVRPEISRA
jgi:hypothetical protein